MKKLLILSIIMILGISSISVKAENETVFTRDFTFGMSDRIAEVKPFSEDDDGKDTFERFLQSRNSLPAEIPVFKPYEPDGKIKIFVSPSGEDSAKGDIDSPLKTIEAAIQRASEIKDKRGGIVIFLREGAYERESQLDIPKYMKGSDENPIIISAYNNEKVQIVGGKTISGKDFKPADGTALRRLPLSSRDYVYYADLEKLNIDIPEISNENGEPDIVVNGLKYHAARWPNTTETYMTKYTEGEFASRGVIHPGKVTYHEDPLNNYSGGFEFVMESKKPFTWENDGNLWMYGAFEVEYARSYVNIKEFHEKTNSVLSTSEYNIGHGFGARYAEDNTYYFLNVMEELDIPGEYYIDKKDKKLYIYPYGDIKDCSVTIPQLRSEVIRFSDGSSNVVLNNIEIISGISNAIILRGKKNIVQNCKMHGKTSIEQAEKCGVIGCISFGDISTSMHQSGNTTGCYRNILKKTGNFVQNNYFYDGSSSSGRGVGDIFSHNSYNRCAYSCLGADAAQGTIIEYNEAVGVPYKAKDSGVFYAVGSSDLQGTHVRYNFFHDSGLIPRGSPFSIYYDDMGSNNYAYGNILRDGMLFSHGGSDMVFYNNIIVDENTNSSIADSNNYYLNSMAANYAKYYLNPGKNDFPDMKAENERWLKSFPIEAERHKDFKRLAYDRSPYDTPVPSDKRTEFDWYVSAVKRNVYKNNITFNAIAPRTSIEAERGQFVEGNYAMKDANSFEDYENRNYNLKDGCEVYQNVSDFEKLDQSKMGTIVNDFYFGEKPKITNLFAAYPTEACGKIFIENIEYIWSEAEFALYYDFELSDDENFDNILFSKRVETVGVTPEINYEADKKYYWRVTAYTLSQSLDRTPVTVEASFETLDRAAAAKLTVLNTTPYDNAVSLIETKMASIIEDNGTDIGIGTYKPGTINKIKQLLSESKSIIASCQLNSDISYEIKRLNSKFSDILSECSIPYTRKYNIVEQSDWVFDDSKMEFKDNIWTASTEEYDWIRDKRIIAPNETISVDINLGDMAKWNPFALKQTSAEATDWAGAGYYIVYKQDLVEIQKHGKNQNGVVDVAENNGAIFSPNTWHHLEYSFNNTDEYVNIKVKVDGKDVFDYYDTMDDRIYDQGYFGFAVKTVVGPEFKLRAAK